MQLRALSGVFPRQSSFKYLRTRRSPSRWTFRPCGYSASAAEVKDTSFKENLFSHELDNVAAALHEARDFHRDAIGGSGIWESRLQAAFDDLSIDRPLRVGFIGDAAVRAPDLISALTQDPYSSVVTLAKAPQATSSRPISSSFFAPQLEKNLDVDLVDVRGDFGDRSSREDVISKMLRIDLNVIMLDQYRLMDAYRGLLDATPGPFHLVINGRIPDSKTQQRIIRVLESHFSTPPASTTFVDASKALQALRAFTDGLSMDAPPQSPSRMRNIQDFQEGFTSSGLDRLRDQLLTSITPQYRRATAQRAVSAALASADRELARENIVTREVNKVISDLEREAEKTASMAKHLSVAGRGIHGGMVDGGPQYAVHRSRQTVISRFRNRLTWLSLLLRLKVDETASEMMDILKGFGADLERELVFDSGRLQQMQEDLSRRTDIITHRLAGNSGHPFSSPLLLNHLASLSLSIPPYESDTMIRPVESRREQLQITALPRLQKAATRILLTTLPLTAFGVLNSWLLYAPPISLISAEAAIGLAVFSGVASIAVGQRMWNKAQRKFLGDFDRIVALLREDVKDQLDTSIEVRLVAKTRAAIEGLRQLTDRRSIVVTEAYRRLYELRDRSSSAAMSEPQPN